MRRPLLALVALVALPFFTGVARAADPIMPLSDVKAGMHCTALSVIQGTTISSFKADVIDVVLDPSVGAQILIRVSGPAVDATGIGPGFSGSPIYCLDTNGVSRNAGAISYGLGDYGNKLALVTPIEQILGEPVSPPAASRVLTTRERRSVAQLASPLTLTGLTPSLADRITAAARSRHLTVLAVPGRPLNKYAPQVLKPGSAFSVGLSSGDVELSAIGTVAYTSGNTVWGFGHALDGVGRRSLLLQDAYVYTVVNNPNGDFGITYKLAAPGNDLGVLTGDSFNAVTGTIGALPAITDLTVTARDVNTGETRTTHTRVADEIALGPPTGASPLRIVAPTAVADNAVRVLHSEPAQVTSSMCVKATLVGYSRTLSFCNRYVSDAGLGDPPFDVDTATGVLDGVVFAGLQVKSLAVDIQSRRGLAEAFLTRGKTPKRLRRGHKATIALTARVVRGANRVFTFPLKVPGNLRPGRYDLVISGPSATPSSGDIGSFLAQLVGGDTTNLDSGAVSFAELAKRFAALGQYDGLFAAFTRPGSGAKNAGAGAGSAFVGYRLTAARKKKKKKGSGGVTSSPPVKAYRNADLRLDGTLTLPVEVVR